MNGKRSSSGVSERVSAIYWTLCVLPSDFACGPEAGHHTVESEGLPSGSGKVSAGKWQVKGQNPHWLWPTHRFQVLRLHSKLSREWLHFTCQPSLSWSKHTFSGKVSYFLPPYHYALFMIFYFPPKYSFYLFQLSWHPLPIITHLNFISLTLQGPF